MGVWRQKKSYRGAKSAVSIWSNFIVIRNGTGPGLISCYLLFSVPSMMVTMNGSELLAEYRRCGSETAFSQLVRRYGNLVYSVSKRRVRDTPLAEEVTQSVFARLAQASPKLSSEGELVAWLHRTTIHVAIDVWRSETRRRARELKAAAMEPACSEDSALWEEIIPYLDEGLNQLASADRQAVLLRFFQQQSMREVGHAMGVSEDAAKMRVGRAVERLRVWLAAKGVHCTVVTLTSLMLSRGIEAAPAHLLAKLDSLKLLEAGGLTGTGTMPWLLRLLIMSKAKILTTVLMAVALGLGVAIHHATKPSQAAESSAVSEEASVPSETRSADSARRSARLGAALTRADNPAAIEDLKSELRAMLQRPQPARGGYPPQQLRELLAKFGNDALEAVPILLEALAVSDYETRVWAAGGLQVVIVHFRETPEQMETSRQAFALARPALAGILQSQAEPGLLRMIALQAFLPPIVYSNGAALNAISLYTGAREDLITTLSTPDKAGFRFTVVDQLTGYLAEFPQDLAPFVAALRPMLNDAQSGQRFLAAYALASWPGEKSPEVKGELLREMADRSKHSYRAASALGKLGPEALDTIPDLLAYAEATKNWGAGYANNALEAVCRIKPELRTEYAEIDQKLKQEEGAMIASQSLGKWVSTLDKAGDSDFVQALTGSLGAGPNAEHARESLLSSLETELARAPEDQRAALTKAIKFVRETPAEAEEEPVHARPLALGNLTLDARVLLVDGENADRSKIEEVLAEFDGRRLQTGSKPKVTAENYSALSQALWEIDPQFQGEWRKAILKNYPWLDRILPAESP